MESYEPLLQTQPEENNRRRFRENIAVLTAAILTVVGLCGYNDQETVEAGTTALPKNNCTVDVTGVNNDGTVNVGLGSDCKGAFGQRPGFPVDREGREGDVVVGDTLSYNPDTNKLEIPHEHNPKPTPSSNPDTAFSITPEATSSSK